MNEIQSGMSIDEIVRAGMNVVNGDEYKKAFVAVSHATADVLKKTLGPFGHTTVIDDGQFRYSTKDGWSLMNRLGFGDPLYNTMYSFIRSISYNLVSKVGDGTTTATVAADAFIHVMEEDTSLQKYRQRDILSAMQKVMDKVIEQLHTPKYMQVVTPDNDWEDIYNIAYTSTNENEEIASLVREIYQKTNNPNIYVNLGNTTETSAEITTGYRLDCAPKDLSVFANTDEHEYNDNASPICFFINHNVTYTDHPTLITELSKIAAANRTTVLVFAPYFDEMMASRLHEAAMNFSRNNQIPTIMMIQLPMANSVQKQFFNDAAIITNAQIFTPAALHACLQAWTKKNIDGSDAPEATQLNEMGFSTPEELIRTYIGRVGSVHAGEKFVLFKNYNTDNQLLKNAIFEAKQRYDEERAKASKIISPLNKDYMDSQLRYIRLMGNMGTINVGGNSEQEKQFLKDVVDDAVLACRSSYENGYVKGLNLATMGAIADILHNSEDGESLTDVEFDVLKCLYKVYRRVCFAVMQNKYPDSNIADEIWCKSVKRSYDVTSDLSDEIKDGISAADIISTCVRENMGFNIVTEKFEKVGSFSVINSILSDIEVLKACVSILTYVLTSNQLVSVNRVYDTAAKKKILENETREKYHAIAEEFHAVFGDLDLNQKPAIINVPSNPGYIGPSILPSTPFYPDKTIITCDSGSSEKNTDNMAKTISNANIVSTAYSSNAESATANTVEETSNSTANEQVSNIITSLLGSSEKS